MKAGYKTTEFWLTLVTLLANAFAPDDFPKESLIGVAGYAIARAITKFKR